MITSTLRTPTPDLERSASFYERLGFTRLSAASRDGGAAFADGRLIVEIDPERVARTALVLHGDDALALRDAVAAHSKVVERDGDLLVADPSGAFVWLTPDAPPALPEPAPASLVGNFHGVSIEALDPERSVAFWTALGFQVTEGGPDQGWSKLERDRCIPVSVMGVHACPHLFFNPGLTYFNAGRNPEIIAALRAADVPIAEEITIFNDQGVVDNVILQDPGGTGFFVFND